MVWRKLIQLFCKRKGKTSEVGDNCSITLHDKKKSQISFLIMVILPRSLYATSLRLTERGTFWQWYWEQTRQPALNAGFLQGLLSNLSFFIRFKELASGLRMDFSEPVMQFVNASTFLASFQSRNTDHLGYTKQHWVLFWRTMYQQELDKVGGDQNYRSDNGLYWLFISHLNIAVFLLVTVSVLLVSLLGWTCDIRLCLQVEHLSWTNHSSPTIVVLCF